MSTPDLPVLDLRCRDAEWIDRPATLHEFARPAAPPDPFAALAELLIADMVARTQTEIAKLLDGRVLLTVEHARFGIPVGVRDLDTPPIEDWHIREQLDVDLLDASEDGRSVRSLAAQFRRGLIAVAGALPLLASPMLAHAHAPLEPAALARMTIGFAPPKLPEETQPAPAPAPAPSPEATTAAPTVEPPPTTTAPQVTAAPPPRIAGDTLTLTGTTVWEGLLGKRVRLAMKNEQVLDGTVVAQSTTDLAVARTSDGTVVAVPKSEISGVRLALTASPGASDMPMSERPRDDGYKLYGGGAAMIGIGSAAALAGTVMLGIYVSYLFISLPLLLPGLAMIGGGASMMSSAGKKRKAYRQAWGMPATAKLNLVPTVSGSRNGGQVGLVLRF
ncbi:MAG TPA: hypothetical protein VM869_09845 [Enhygromyxa sp.]|nr:hypothetical protein [Enhygromyxa sp.]